MQLKEIEFLGKQTPLGGNYYNPFEEPRGTKFFLILGALEAVYVFVKRLKSNSSIVEIVTGYYKYRTFAEETKVKLACDECEKLKKDLEAQTVRAEGWKYDYEQRGEVILKLEKDFEDAEYESSRLSMQLRPGIIEHDLLNKISVLKREKEALLVVNRLLSNM